MQGRPDLHRTTGFCVLADVGVNDGQAKKALNSVKEKLATKYGIVLLQPAYTTYHLNLGEISSYSPGYKENAGIFCHNNPWYRLLRRESDVVTEHLRSTARPALLTLKTSVISTTQSHMCTHR